MTRPVQLQLAGPPLKNLKSSCSPRQKTALWRVLYGSCPVILFFPVIFSLSTNQFLPTNYFSTPRGYVKTKKVLHTFGTAPFRHSSTYLLCQSLGIDPVDEARKSDRVPNMFKLTDPVHNPLQSHPEPRVRNATKFPQVQVPRVALRVPALFLDPRDKSIVILYPLPTPCNLAVSLRSQEIYGESNLWIQRIRLVIERLRLLRIPRHEEGPIEMNRQNLLLLIAQIITPPDPRLLSTNHLERIIIGDSRKWRLDLLQVLSLSLKES